MIACNKTCTKCNNTKAVSEFYVRKASRDGLDFKCKQCSNLMCGAHKEANRDSINAKQRELYHANGDENRAKRNAAHAANPEKSREQSAKWRANNPGGKRKHDRDYYEKNKDTINANNRDRWHQNKEQNIANNMAWKAKNKGRVNASHAKRRAAKMNAAVSWANDFFIEEIYDLSRIRSEVFGFKWHVDHIIPLQAVNASGLHVEHNLQVIPAYWNISKGNRIRDIKIYSTQVGDL